MLRFVTGTDDDENKRYVDKMFNTVKLGDNRTNVFESGSIFILRENSVSANHKLVKVHFRCGLQQKTGPLKCNQRVHLTLCLHGRCTLCNRVTSALIT